VTLNAERNAIESYPAPSDVYYNGNYAVPFELIDGYLLDNRGITSQVAFLDITYEEYSKLVDVNVEFLWQHIKDATPLVELYRCGNRNILSDEVEELNQVIRNGFKGCQRIKIPPTAVIIFPGKE
jgi:hypothetical protein